MTMRIVIPLPSGNEIEMPIYRDDKDAAYVMAAFNAVCNEYGVKPPRKFAIKEVEIP